MDISEQLDIRRTMWSFNARFFLRRQNANGWCALILRQARSRLPGAGLPGRE
jgi:hypothetical protein